MKIWMIIAVFGLLAVAGLVVASNGGSDDSALEEEPVVTSAPTCGGACSAGQTCSNTGCGAKVGKTCGCGR